MGATTRKRRVAAGLVAIVAVVGAVAGVAVLHGNSGRSCSLIEATAIAEDRALVACRSWRRDKIAPDLALWSISLGDGRRHHEVEIERDHNQWVRVIGEQGGRLWVRIGDHGLRAYQVADPRDVRTLDGALASHPILSRGMTSNAWVSDDGAVLQGKDNERYVVTAGGAIERSERGAEERWNVSESEAAVVGGPARTPSGAFVRPDGEALVRPRILARQGNPFWLDDGRGVLVLSVDVTGTEGQHRLSRVDHTGKPVWTAEAEGLMRAANARTRGPCKVRDVDLARGTIWATVVCIGYSMNQGTQTMHVDSRLVGLEPATGAARQVVAPNVVN